MNSSATLFVQSSVRKSTSSGYHPAPNICVEGGRIEFIKSPSEGSNLASLNPPVTLPPRPGFDKGSARKGISSQYADVSQCKKDVVAATRAQHTQADLADFDFNEEKCDVAKVRWQLLLWLVLLREKGTGEGCWHVTTCFNIVQPR